MTILSIQYIHLSDVEFTATGLGKPVEILNGFNNSCTIDRVREIETAQAEVGDHFSEGNFPLPLLPKDESSNVLLRIWFDNFDVKVENMKGSIHTTHGVAFFGILETNKRT